jgi:hypothetical protein
MIAENIKRLTDKGVLAAYADEQYKKLQREKTSIYHLMSIAQNVALSKCKLFSFRTGISITSYNQ